MDLIDELAGRTHDIAALALFLVVWFAYEPAMKALARNRRLINSDLVQVRMAWMREMSDPHRQRLLDSQLVGHALNSASFFASSNLILIAAAAGVLFGGEGAYRRIQAAPLLVHAPTALLGLKLALVAITLARGLLSFIWAIRQLNYTVAVIGAAPLHGDEAHLKAYADAAAAVLNPAMRSFNAGVRGYYFALAAAAWLAGPLAFAVTTVGGAGLLAWRQRFSPAAQAVRNVRRLLDEAEG
jgi:uncharacterized membrane protein